MIARSQDPLDFDSSSEEHLVTIQDYLKEKTALLARAGIDDAETEAFLCFEDSSGMSRAQIRLSLAKDLSECLPEEVISRIDDCYTRRAAHEPLAYIVRKAPFFDLMFSVGPGVLIPRFDTEVLVETALGCLGFPQMIPGAPELPTVRKNKTERTCNTVTNTGITEFELEGEPPVFLEEPDLHSPVKILDLCTGSGCVGITIAHELQKKDIPFDLLMTDISPEAAAYAKENAERILVSKIGCTWQVIVTDLWPKITPAGTSDDRSSEEASCKEKFDLIVSNPPYVTKEEMAELMPEVKDHEPDLALTDGGDGLLMYRRIADGLKDFLAPGGVIAVEHGCSQGEAVREILSAALDNMDTEAAGEEDTKAGSRTITIKDYGNNDRVTCGRGES